MQVIALKKVKLVLASLVAVMVAVIVIGFCLPSQWKVERSIVIKAPPAMIYPYLANLKYGWPQWSAFDSEDPDIQYTYLGPDEGVGARRNWVSKRMGKGTQVITRADIMTGVEFELRRESGSSNSNGNSNSDGNRNSNEFNFAGKFSFAPEARESTRVTWVDYGDVGGSLRFRYMGGMMDQTMGKSLETSLAKLKEKVEAGMMGH